MANRKDFFINMFENLGMNNIKYYCPGGMCSLVTFDYPNGNHSWVDVWVDSLDSGAVSLKFKEHRDGEFRNHNVGNMYNMIRKIADYFEDVVEAQNFKVDTYKCTSWGWGTGHIDMGYVLRVRVEDKPWEIIYPSRYEVIQRYENGNECTLMRTNSFTRANNDFLQHVYSCIDCFSYTYELLDHTKAYPVIKHYEQSNFDEDNYECSNLKSLKATFSK